MQSKDTVLPESLIALAVAFSLFLFSRVCVPLHAQSQSPSAAAVLRLQDAVSLALEKNHDVQVAALELRKSQEEVFSARTKLFPSSKSYLLGSHLPRADQFRVSARRLRQLSSHRARSLEEGGHHDPCAVERLCFSPGNPASLSSL